MNKYQDPNGTSGIDAFEVGEDFIRIKYKNNTVYLYTNASAGSENIRQMKALAHTGRGLNTFINQHAHNNYAEKEK